MYDPNANPEHVAARAAELALEQNDRLSAFLVCQPDNGAAFYAQPFEAGISNKIARMMAAYALLKGYVTAEQAGLTEVSAS